MPQTAVQAPEGAEWEYQELFTDKGTVTLGEIPILKWNSLDAVIAKFGDAKVLGALNGPSLHVAYQNTARRMKVAGKPIDEIAQWQVDYIPGEVKGGASTPKSRVKKAAASAVEKVGDAQAATITALLAKIASGEVDIESLKAQLGA